MISACFVFSFQINMLIFFINFKANKPKNICNKAPELQASSLLEREYYVENEEQAYLIQCCAEHRLKGKKTLQLT